MTEYTKDELILLNGILKLALADNLVQKTDNTLALQQKVKAHLKEMI